MQNVPDQKDNFSKFWFTDFQSMSVTQMVKRYLRVVKLIPMIQCHCCTSHKYKPSNMSWRIQQVDPVVKVVG